VIAENAYTPEIVNQVVDYAFTEKVYGEQARREQVFEEVDGMSDIKLHILCSEFDALSKFALPRHTICGESAKLRRLRQLLPSLQRDGHRMLIYSQWSDMLDILEELCLELQMDYSRLDGRTPVPDRQKIIDDFNDDASVPICLMSTRGKHTSNPSWINQVPECLCEILLVFTAGVGINLLGADTVIFHDVDINPQNDHQAESRCYRLGQTRTVTVYKMFTDDTVDSAIADIAIRSDTSLQIRRSDVDVDDMQLDGGSAAAAAASGGGGGEEQVAWKNVVSEALDGLGLFEGDCDTMQQDTEKDQPTAAAAAPAARASPQLTRASEGAAAAASGSAGGGRRLSSRQRKPAAEVATLMDMGFGQNACEEALRKAKGDYNQALSELIGET
jgi:hypothetical protein